MSFRVYGRAGSKIITGIINDQVGGTQDLIPDEHETGSVGLTSRPNVRLIPVAEASGTETHDAFVATTKNSSVRDLADIGSGSETTLANVPNNNDEVHRGTMNTGIEVKKPTDNIYY